MIQREMILAVAIFTGLAIQADAQERWAGWYGGVSLNGTSVDSDVGSNATHRYEEDFANIGGFIGYNVARRGNYVWGGEVALSGLDDGAQRSDAALGGSRLSGKALLQTRFRAGYATEKSYIYGIVGLGFSEFGAEPSVGADESAFGALGFGVGAEFALDDAWSVRSELVHYGWEDDSQTFNGTRPKVDNGITQISIGLARKF